MKHTYHRRTLMHFTTLPQLRRMPIIVLVLAVISLIPVAVVAQSDRGRIVGIVTDSNGGIVPGTNVVVKNDRNGDERSATTNQEGKFVVAGLKPSIYTVTATAQNLTVRVSNVQLLVGQELNLPLTLQATGVEAKVDVVATSDKALDTGSASISVNVNPREV